MTPTLVVMAAGIGSRYGGMKQLDPIGPRGEIILDYSIYDALRAGFGKVVLVIKEETAEIFREKIGRRFEKRVETSYALQRLADLPLGFAVPDGRQKPWGTAHAVYAARQAVNEPFAVINADDFYGPSSYHLLRRQLGRIEDKQSHDYCMVGYELKKTLTKNGHVARGICRIGADGFLIEVRERTRIERRDGKIAYTEDGRVWSKLPPDSTVSMNMWGFAPSLFGEIEGRFSDFLRANADDLLTAEYFLPDVVTALLREGKASVRVLASNERWFGITYRQDKPTIEEAVSQLTKAGLYPANLWGDELC